MNYGKYFVGAGILALATTSCSNDIDITPDVPTGEGRTAFMTINLHDVNRGTRAGEDEENDIFNDGTEDEYAIESARFFFFDASGVYVSEASVWTGSHMVDDVNDNITLEGNTVVVLENLQSKQNPRYMLTVLNGNGFVPASTLEATRMKLTQWNNTIEGKQRFVMTTASYFSSDSNDKNHADVSGGTNSFNTYFASVLADDNFIEGLPDSDGDGVVDNLGNVPVDVYVERLAGKVELDYSQIGTTHSYKGEDGKKHKIYKLNATVAGNPNNEGTDDEGVTDVYVEILGWDINGTNPASYFSKNIDAFMGNDPWLNWNVGQFHRSYWAQSYGYNDKANHDLDYVAYKDIPLDPNTEDDFKTSVRYANEFTTTPTDNYLKDGDIIASELTHVVLKTRLCDVNGNDLDLVRAKNGVLYNRLNKKNTTTGRVYSGYLSYVLNLCKISSTGLNVWILKESGENGDVYAQVDETNVKLVSSGKGTGKVKVVADLKEKDGSNQNIVYAKQNEDGKTFTKMSYTNAVAALNECLNIGNNDGTAEAFTGGASYYTIPIEHETSVGDKENRDYKEGYYGFVRNHWYKLNITQLITVGHGIFDPETEIVKPETPEDPAFFVTANLKVLAWKMVYQDVPL